MSKRNSLKLDMLDVYNEALVAYKKREFEAALQLFEKVVAHTSGDGPSELYIARCKAYIEEPPPEDWDGVYTMTTK